MQTDISLSQYLAIQEKGVSAWEFEPELEIANCFVEARTEVEFFDAECTVLSNLPVPKQNDVYYWEAKIYDKPENTLMSIGMATKPYPLFRLPGKEGPESGRALWPYANLGRQASTSSRWLTSQLARAAITSRSTQPLTVLRLSRATLLVLATDRGRGQYSSRGTARDWRTWSTA